MIFDTLDEKSRLGHMYVDDTFLSATGMGRIPPKFIDRGVGGGVGRFSINLVTLHRHAAESPSLEHD